MAKKKTKDEDDVVPQRGRRPGDDDDQESVAGTGVSWKVWFDYHTYLAKFQQWKESVAIWKEANPLRFRLVAAACALVCFLLACVYIWHLNDYYHRPTLEMAVRAFGQQQRMSAKSMAESILYYSKKKETEKRATCLYLIGDVTIWQADTVNVPDKIPIYLAAANLLEESEKLGFMPDRKGDGYFALGRAYFKATEYNKAVPALLSAIQNEYSDKKSVYRLLAMAYFRASPTNFDESLRFLELFVTTPPIIFEDNTEATLQKLLILLKQGRLEEAKREMEHLPQSPKYEAMYHFVNGQLQLEEARVLTKAAVELERRYLLSPHSLLDEPNNGTGTGTDQSSNDGRTSLGATGHPDAATLQLPSEAGD